jgi:hypothetical protein
MQTERSTSITTKDKVFDITVIKNGLFWSFTFLWTMLIALAWGGEEPGKIQTIIAVFTVFILAILIIGYAKNKGIITSKKLWIFIFLIKLTLTVIILQYLWIPAFTPHRATGTFDPIVFDYYGKLLAEGNFNVNLIYQVYNYVGQIYYIGIIYWLFGVSTFYVGIFNALFSLVTFLAITAILVGCSGNKKGWYLMGLGMLFPELLYYDAIPGKEVISTCMVALSILFIYKFLVNKDAKYLLFLLLSLGVLTSVRAVMSIVVIAIGTIWIIVKYKHKLKLIFLYGTIAVFVLLFLFPLIIKYTGGTPATVGTFLDLPQTAEYGIRITPGEKSLNVMFTTSDHIKATIFAPVRTIFCLVAPFPRLSIDWTEISWLSNFTRISVWIILLCLPIIIAATFQKRCRKSPPWFYVVFTYWILLLLISNGALIIHERYRVMADPFFVGSLLVGIKYGNPKKFILPSFILIILGYLAYYILKQFA